ncbi:MAG: NAD(P)-dependent oxidoreductase [Deinococcota bacterium]
MSETSMKQHLRATYPSDNLNFTFEPDRNKLQEHLATTTILVDGSAQDIALDAPKLKHVIVPWAGTTQLRDKLLARPHLTLHNSHYNASFVAQYAVAMMFAAAHRLPYADRRLRTGDWTMRYDTSFGAMQLAGKTVLLLGYGAIGQAIARLLHPFGMKVTVLKRTPDVYDSANADILNRIYTPADMFSALAAADVIMCSLPLTPTTETLLDARALSHLKPHSILVNVGRGQVIHEEALYNHLLNQPRCVAALDVWWQNAGKHTDEPSFPATYPFWELPNVIMGPHRAGQVKGNNQTRFEDVAQTIAALCRGEMRNQVNIQQGY